MGLFGDIGKFVGGAIKTVTGIAGGPVSVIGGLAGDVIAGKPPKLDPTRLLPLPGRTGVNVARQLLSGSGGGISGHAGGSFTGGVAFGKPGLTGSQPFQYGPSTSLPEQANRYPQTVGHTGGLNMGGFGPQIMPVTTVQEARAPKGYRVHTVTPSTAPLLNMAPGTKVAVQLGSPAARVLGVKRSKKPVLSVRDSEALKRAARAQDKVARVAKGAGLHVYKNARRTR